MRKRIATHATATVKNDSQEDRRLPDRAGGDARDCRRGRRVREGGTGEGPFTGATGSLAMLQFVGEDNVKNRPR
jgi:hypothetical protein